MSNANPELDYGNLSEVLRFTFEQMLKGVYTALPGIVESYNPSTKRARVTVALDVLRTDGTLQDSPTVANCPVLHPSGGGFVVHMPINAGDAVLMIFTQRGISKFKQTFSKTAPCKEALLSVKDAVVIPGFGGLSISPATTAGASMQTEDGSNHVYVEDNHVRVTSTGTVQVDSGGDTIINPSDTVLINGNLCVDGNVGWSGNATNKDGTGPACMTNGLKIVSGNVTHNGTDIGDSHTHPGDSGGTTGTPN